MRTTFPRMGPGTESSCPQQGRMVSSLRLCTLDPANKLNGDLATLPTHCKPVGNVGDHSACLQGPVCTRSSSTSFVPEVRMTFLYQAPFLEWASAYNAHTSEWHTIQHSRPTALTSPVSRAPVSSLELRGSSCKIDDPLPAQDCWI